MSSFDIPPLPLDQVFSKETSNWLNWSPDSASPSPSPLAKLDGFQDSNAWPKDQDVLKDQKKRAHAATERLARSRLSEYIRKLHYLAGPCPDGKHDKLSVLRHAGDVISSFKRHDLQHRHQMRTMLDVLQKQRQTILSLHAENVRLSGKLGLDPVPEPSSELVNFSFLLPGNVDALVTIASENTARRSLGPEDVETNGLGASDSKPSGWSCLEESAAAATRSSWSVDPSDDEDPVIHLPANWSDESPVSANVHAQLVATATKGDPRDAGTLPAVFKAQAGYVRQYTRVKCEPLPTEHVPLEHPPHASALVDRPPSSECASEPGEYNSSCLSASPPCSETMSSVAPSSGSSPSNDLSSSSSLDERDSDSGSTFENGSKLRRSESMLSVPVSPPHAQPQPVSDTDGAFAFKYRRKPCRASILGRSKRAPFLSTLPPPTPAFPRDPSPPHHASPSHQAKQHPHTSPPCTHYISSDSVSKTEEVPSLQLPAPPGTSIGRDCDIHPPPSPSALKRCLISPGTASEDTRQKRSKATECTDRVPQSDAGAFAEDVQFEGIFLDDDALDTEISPNVVEFFPSDASGDAAHTSPREDFDAVSFALTDLQESDGFASCSGSRLSTTAFGMSGIGDDLLDWPAPPSSCDRLKEEHLCSVAALPALVETALAHTSRLASIPVRSSLGSERGCHGPGGQTVFISGSADLAFEADDLADEALFSSVLSMDDCPDENLSG